MEEHTIENIIISQLKKYDPEFVGLFGSYTLPGNSYRDIDILIKLRQKLSLLQLIRLENRLSELLGIKTDLVTTGSLQNERIKKNIMKQLKIIYQA